MKFISFRVHAQNVFCLDIYIGTAGEVTGLGLTIGTVIAEERSSEMSAGIENLSFWMGEAVLAATSRPSTAVKDVVSCIVGNLYGWW